MDLITDKLALGNSADARDETSLLMGKIDAVLNVAIDLSAPPSDKDLYRLDRFRVGLTDGSENRPTDLVAAALFLYGLEKRYNRILVHCHAGHSRSPTIIALRRAWELHTDLDTQYSFIATKRPGIAPAPNLVTLAEEALRIMRQIPPEGLQGV